MDYLIEHFDNEIDAFCRNDEPDFYPVTESSLNLHMHNYFELYLFISGHAEFFIDNRFYSLPQGCLIFINNDQVHGPKGFNHENLKRNSVHFSPDLAKRLSTKQTDLLKPFKERRNVIPLNHQQLAVMETAYERLVLELTKPICGSEILIYSYFTEILINAQRFAEVQTSKEHSNHLSPLVTNLLDYIQEETTNPNLSLDELEVKFNYSKIYLNRIFKKELGVTIYQYILMSRVSTAKRQLRESSDVQLCCEKSGFNDYTNFIRTFKKFTGMSPKQFNIKVTKI